MNEQNRRGNRPTAAEKWVLGQPFPGNIQDQHIDQHTMSENPAIDAQVMAVLQQTG
jgi:hypothetical protein